MKRKLIQAILAVVAIGLSYYLYDLIMDPIRFNNEYKKRRAAVIERLVELRTAQVAYKTENGKYAKNFEELFAFIETGKFTIIQRRDSTFQAMNQEYQIMELRDTVLVDTLGYAAIKDSLFPERDLDELRYIPYAKRDKEFVMDAGEVEKTGGLKIHVVEILAPKELWCRGLDKMLVKTNAKDLKVGSMTEASINGNWQ
jgi:hypothetical protein